VEQQHQTGEAVAWVDVAIVQQAAKRGESLLVVERRRAVTGRVPGDVKLSGDAGEPSSPMIEVASTQTERRSTSWLACVVGLVQ
jgi:hypothetical protein